MLANWLISMKHMAEEHPNSAWFGFSDAMMLEGELVSCICQICGKELVEGQDVTEGVEARVQSTSAGSQE